MAAEQTIIIGQIIEYNEFRQQVAELIKTNRMTAFDYESDKGEKEARSYVYKLRQSKSAIDKKRKELGEGLVERKRLIDGEAKRLIETVDGMIDVHMKPLEEKAEREARRVAEIDNLIKDIRSHEVMANPSLPSDRLKTAYNDLMSIDITKLQEREQEGGELQQMILERIARAIDAAVRREEEQREAERIRQEQQAELERLRKAEAERAEQERKKVEEQRKKDEAERLQREADERAKKAAEAEAQRRIQEAEAAQRKAEQEAARIKQEAEAAEAKRIRDAEIVEQKRLADEREAARKEQERITNLEHRKTINNAAKDALIAVGLADEQAITVVRAIASGEIPHIIIQY